MFKCYNCKHFKNFKYSQGCDKQQKILLPNETNENKNCFEAPPNGSFDGNMKDMFDMFFGR